MTDTNDTEKAQPMDSDEFLSRIASIHSKLQTCKANGGAWISEQIDIGTEMNALMARWNPQAERDARFVEAVRSAMRDDDLNRIPSEHQRIYGTPCEPMKMEEWNG